MDIVTFATLQVVIDNQAWLAAAQQVGLDAPDDEFQEIMEAWKESTAELIEQQVDKYMEQVMETGESAADEEHTDGP